MSIIRKMQLFVGTAVWSASPQMQALDCKALGCTVQAASGTALCSAAHTRTWVPVGSNVGSQIVNS